MFFMSLVGAEGEAIALQIGNMNIANRKSIVLRSSGIMSLLWEKFAKLVEMALGLRAEALIMQP